MPLAANPVDRPRYTLPNKIPRLQQLTCGAKLLVAKKLQTILELWGGTGVQLKQANEKKNGEEHGAADSSECDAE